ISTSIAQFVIDQNGEPVEEGDKYFIRPPIAGNVGRFTLVSRNRSCPLNVGLEIPGLPHIHGFTVVFIPFVNRLEIG
ncbi:Alpha-amylase/subtilisin inhibitor, partial [Trifolium medium]|nr:Alpha-amylase/subtilisin inhibitor [Trifolium medium]